MIEFSEFALAGLVKYTEDADRATALRHSISLHLSNPEAIAKSFGLAEPVDRALYMYPLGPWRVTWEPRLDGGGIVWTVALLSNAK